MDTSSFTCFTPEVKRLTSFQHTPLPNQHKFGVSNSPAKFAKAGFMRRDDAINDEVSCEYCGIVYDEWSGESPFAVHRVLNEHCPFLNTPSPLTPIQNHPRVEAARRRLFTEEVTTATDADIDDTDDVTSSGTLSDDDVEEDVNDEVASERINLPEHDHDTDSDADDETENESDAESGASTQTPLPAFTSVLLNPKSDFDFPFQPKVGDSSLLFASRRLKTFSDPGCPEFVELAEEGFVYRPDIRDVQCVFCGLVLPFHTCEPKQAHTENSKFCPRVLLKDVGNISTTEEERIRRKNLQRQLRNKSVLRSYAVCHPQFEDQSVRAGTFENWPHNSWDESLGATAMSEAGFFFTGLADKVRCFFCGVGVLKWRQGADPWVQHALHMPTCPHLLVKGQHFIEQAAQAQALTEADIPSSSNTNSSPEASPGLTGQVVTSPPGSLMLDMSAVTAALSTSQYTIQQVRHAVLTFFCHTSRYPTKDILLGTLRAADENFTALRQQRDVIHQKDTVIHQKDTVIHQKDTVIHQKDTVIHQKDTVIQQTHTELQQTHTELQQTHTELQQTHQVIQQHQQELQHKVEELQLQREETQRHLQELERKNQQMRYQESQIESLKIQMQALLAERRQAGLQAAPLRAGVAQNVNVDGVDSTMCDIRCKVCLSEESNTIFTPCHHITCCSHCAMQLVSDCCPVCRAPIRDMLPAYIA